jgi:hypothetical protein
LGLEEVIVFRPQRHTLKGMKKDSGTLLAKRAAKIRREMPSIFKHPQGVILIKLDEIKELLEKVVELLEKRD